MHLIIIDCKLELKVCDSASLEFLREVTSGAGKSIIKRCLLNEKLLHTEPLEQMPDDHKPNDEWIAARLKIKHEFRTRMAAGVQRKLKRQTKNGAHNAGDELWMHVKPALEELREWRLTTRALSDGVEDDSDGAVEKEEDGVGEPDIEVTNSSTVDESDGKRSAAAGRASADDAPDTDTWLGAHPALKKDSTAQEEQNAVLES